MFIPYWVIFIVAIAFVLVVWRAVHLAHVSRRLKREVDRLEGVREYALEDEKEADMFGH